MPEKKPPRARAEKPLPRCKAILLCDHTIVEAGTGKVSLIGIVHAFAFPTFPALTRPMTAYLQLTEGIGRYEVGLEIRDLAMSQAIAQARGAAIEFADRLATVQLMLPIPALALQHMGPYEVLVFANGQEIDRQKFTALSVAGAGGGSV
jgi:hypothetical protein